MASAVLATSSLGLHVPRTSQLRPRSLSAQMRAPIRRSYIRSGRAPLRTNAGLERTPQSQPPITSNDILSASLGAFCCTSFFYAGGQDGWEALSVTLFAAVTALVLNRVLPK